MKKLCVFFLILITTVTGCGSTDDTESTYITSTEIDSSEDVVSLSCVVAPKFRDDFCTLNYDGCYQAVQWGDGAVAIMWKESGYPGFDYPMVIEMTNTVSSANVILTVSWGVYQYNKVVEGTAFCENNNLIDSDTGDALVEWCRVGEYLVIWNSVSGEYSKYVLQEGTKIVE